MKYSILCLLALGLASVIGLFIAHVPAFLLLQIGAYSIAAPLWLCVLTLLLLMALFILIRKVFRRALILPQKLRNNLEIMRQRQAVRRKIKKIEADIDRMRTAS